MIEKIWRIAVVAFIFVAFVSFFGVLVENAFFHSGITAIALGPIPREYLLGAWRRVAPY